MESTRDISIHIAAVIGPVLVVLSVSEYLNLRIWKKVDATVVYLNGLLFMTAGVLIVHLHNVWIYGWPVVVTVVGWLILLLGVFRMFFPTANQLTEKRVAVYILTALLATGLFLTIQAYSGV